MPGFFVDPALLHSKRKFIHLYSMEGTLRQKSSRAALYGSSTHKSPLESFGLRLMTGLTPLTRFVAP